MNNYFKLVGFQRLFQMYDFLKGEGWIFFNEQKIFCREEGYKGHIGREGVPIENFNTKEWWKNEGFFLLFHPFTYFGITISHTYMDIFRYKVCTSLPLISYMAKIMPWHTFFAFRSWVSALLLCAKSIKMAVIIC